MSSREAEKQRRRDERLAREQADERAQTRRRRLQLAAGVLVVISGAVVVALLTTTNSPPASSRASVVLASTSAEASGEPIDAVRCQASEQPLFHIHTHLAVFVDGRRRIVPQGIGIAAPRQEQQTADGRFVTSGSCFYWLHSHTADGIIHIESPVRRAFTVGNYFDIWKQPLSTNRVGPATGAITTYVNGHTFTGNPRNLRLNAHELIQLDVGTRTPPAPFTFPKGL